MPNFVSDGTSIPVKVARNTPEVPGGEDPNKWVQADYLNLLRGALVDLRGWLLAGKLSGLAEQASRPVVSGATAFLWMNTDGKLVFFDGSDDHILGEAQPLIVDTVADLPLITDEVATMAWVRDVHRWATADAPYWYMDEVE